MDVGFIKQLATDINSARAAAVKPYQEQLAKLQVENERLKEENRWIPVSERLPEDDSSAYLFLHESGNVHRGVPSCNLFGPDGKLWSSITHWRPIILPES